MTGYTLFDTSIGRCGVAWGAKGITALLLPEPDLERGLRRYAAEEATPPAAVANAVRRVVALLDGQVDDLADIEVDLGEASDLHHRVWAYIRTVPPGETVTYGQVAERIGSPGMAQAVGQALGRNPVPVIVPCHRVLGANGKIGGFSAGQGSVTKARILAIEGAAPNGQPALF